MEYPRMKRQAETIMSFPIPGLFVGFFAVPAAANTNSHKDCQIPPIISGLRRPNCGEKGMNWFSLNGDCEKPYLLHNVDSSERTSEIHRAENNLSDETILDTNWLEHSGALKRVR